jgi:hypothetical protein
MAIDLKAHPSCRTPNEPSPPPRKLSVFRRVWRGAMWLGRGPADAVGMLEIRQNAGLIATLFRMLKAAPHTDRRLHLGDGRRIDLRATAFSCGVSEAELLAQIMRRRRQTALAAYVAFTLGCLFVLAWLWRMLRTPWTPFSMVSAFEFLPFCGILFLLAFYNALQNFQLRTGRMAGWWEYLATSESFWPS